MLVKMLPLKYLGNLSIENDCVQVLNTWFICYHMKKDASLHERCANFYWENKMNIEETCLWCSCEGYRSYNLMKCK